MGKKRTTKLFLGTLAETSGRWHVKRPVGPSIPVTVPTRAEKAALGHFLLWRRTGADLRLADVQPSGLLAIQPSQAFPPGTKTSDTATGDPKVDEAVRLLAAGRVNEGLRAVGLRPARTPDDRTPSTSVRVVSGGAAESSRRRH